MRSRVVARSPALRRGLLCHVGVPQHVPRLLEQGGARDGELDAALAAVEELDPELLLEFAHLLAYCRLRDGEGAPLPCGSAVPRRRRRSTSDAGAPLRVLTHAGVKWHWPWRDRSRSDAHIRA